MAVPVIKALDTAINDQTVARFLLSNQQKNRTGMFIMVTCGAHKAGWMIVDGAFDR